MATYTDVQNAFYAELQKQVNQSAVIKAKGITNALPFEQEGTAGFAWLWNMSGNINQLSYDLMNTATDYHQATGAIRASNSSVTDTALDIYTALQYRYSDEDQKAINAAQAKAISQASAVVSAWNQANQPEITDANRKAVGATTDIDFISYTFLKVWGDGKVTWSDITNNRNPRTLFPNMPASAESILNSFVSYVSITSSVATIQNNMFSSSWLKNKLIGALQEPTTNNGGVNVKSPSTGDAAMMPGYNNPPATNTILDGLNSAAAITITLTASKSDASAVSVSVGGKLAGAIPVDFITFTGSAGASYNAFSTAGTGDSVTIEITWNGPTVLNFQPLKFDQSSLKGWYSQQILADAYLNKDVGAGGQPKKSGYVLSGLNQAYRLGDQGNCGYINAALIANPPSIKMTYEHGDYTTFQSHFQEQSSWGISIFGIQLFGGSQSYEKAVSQKESNEKGFSITFPPVKLSESSTTAAEQLASVLAVQAAWMGVAQ